jgi:serine/threonine protein kinase
MMNPATDQTFVSEKYTPRFSPTDRLSARYVVRRYLSRDAIGEVYLCVDRELSRPVTVKVLHQALQEDDAVRSKAISSARAVMGAEALPYVLPMIDILEVAATPEAPALVGFVSPHIEGTSLEDYLASYSQLAFDLGASLFRDVAAALLALHKAGRHPRRALPREHLA